MMRSLLHYRVGALDEAVADAVIATEVAEQHGWGVGLPATVGFLVDALIEQGRLEDAQAALARGGAGVDVPDTLLAQAYIVARGRLALARGALAEAVGHLEELARRPAMGGAASSEHRRTGRTWRRRSRRWASTSAALRSPPRRSGSRAHGARRGRSEPALRVQGVVAGRDGGAALLHEAVAVLARAAARLEHARALADLGAALRRDGQAAAAREPLRAAIDLADRCRDPRPSSRSRRTRLAATGARRRSRLRLSGVEALTPSEQRIARLAAEGRSNAEIAGSLFLTRKTIEMHLGNAYRKLDIASRADLPAALER